MQGRHPGFSKSIARWLLASAVMLVSISSTAATEKSVYSFTGGNDGSDPASQLIFDSAGNAYGTTVTEETPTVAWSLNSHPW